MKDWKNRAVSIALCIGMCLSMSGCKNNNTESNNVSKYTGSILDAEELFSGTIASEGVLENASFEEGLNEYWSIVEKGDGECEVVNDEAYDGKSSLNITSIGHYEVNVSAKVSGLEPGYYYLTGYVKNTGDENACYLYANGSEESRAVTSVPVYSDWSVVTVRGFEVYDDGILNVGVYMDGNVDNELKLDMISIEREADQDTKYQSLFGGTISRLDYVEDQGALFYDSAEIEGDALQIMAENGANVVRLELYNNPGKGRGNGEYYCPEGYQDEEHTLKLAKRASDKGMALQLSFMYSDFWNEGIPDDFQKDIEGVTDTEEIIDILEEDTYEYTKNFMQKMVDQGTVPEYVSLGSEMQGGLYLPYGASETETMENLARFLNAGYKAVKEVSPDSQVVLHIAASADDMKWNGDGMGTWFFGLCKEYGVNYDVIGTSYYPFWGKTTSVQDLTDWCNLMIDQFDKDVLIMESGYNYSETTENGVAGQLANNGYYDGIYESSPQGQRDFMIELINGIKSVKDGRCVGDLYWDPIMVAQEGVGWSVLEKTDQVGANVISNTTWFDFDHIALPVMDAYKYNLAAQNTSTLYGKISDEEGNPLGNTDISIEIGDNTYATTTDAYGTYYIKVAIMNDATVKFVNTNDEVTIASITNVNSKYGEMVNINPKQGVDEEFTYVTNYIDFTIYGKELLGSGEETLYLTVDDDDEDILDLNAITGGAKVDTKEINGKTAFSMVDNEDGWYDLQIPDSVSEIKVYSGDECVFEMSDFTNSDLLARFKSGLETFEYENELYRAKNEVFKEYYIVGSTAATDETDAGIFANYWAENGEFKDHLELGEDGFYHITLDGLKGGTTYVFNVTINEDLENTVFETNQAFNSKNDGSVEITIDVENATASYEFIN